MRLEGVGSRVRGGLYTGSLQSLRVLNTPQAYGRGGQEPQPSWEGQVPLIPVSLDIGKGVWCWSGPWGSKGT